VHLDTDELFQQSPQSISHVNVSGRRYFPVSHLVNTFGSVNPLYYVTFTTATLCASFILYGGFNTSDAVNTLSLLSGFLVIFTGVYLLNISRSDPDGHKMIKGVSHDGIATDIISGIQTRRSMQARRSLEPHQLSSGSNGYGRGGDREGLIHAYDEEENVGFGLTDLAEDSDEDAPPRSANGKANGNGNGKRSFGGPTEQDRSRKLPPQSPR
jgi:hypothetical protein